MDIKNIFMTAVLAMGLSASTASALTITSIDGSWENAGAGVSGQGTDKVRWGTGWKGGQKSGYDFQAADTDLQAVEGQTFVLGTFDHRNFPVTGTFLKAVDLAVSFTVDGVSDAITSVFSFSHLETYNWGRKCGNGGGNWSGVNRNGCADRVTATLNEAKSEEFVIDGVTYVLDILGFHHGGELMSNFWTVENAVNSAELVAVFRTIEGETEIPSVQPPLPPVSEVPLPATGWLLLAGVAGLFAKRRS